MVSRIGPSRPKYYADDHYRPLATQAKKADSLPQLLQQQGAQAVTDWVKQQDRVLLTDTTFRDAHQSLLPRACGPMTCSKLRRRWRPDYHTFF